MRRLAVLILLIAVLAFPAGASAQTPAPVRRLNPPVVKPNLYWDDLLPRKAPPGVPQIIERQWLGGNLTEYSPVQPVPAGMYWKWDWRLHWQPVILTLPGSSYLLTACGIPPGRSIKADLTYPSGRREIVVSDLRLDGGCWGYRVDEKIGMELGLYTLRIRHDGGELSHTWGIDYPYCPTIRRIKHPGSDVKDLLFMGYAPHQSITAHFYFYTPGDYTEYAGTVTFTTGPEGSVALEGTGDAVAWVRIAGTYPHLEPDRFGYDTPSLCETRTYAPSRYPTYIAWGQPAEGMFYRFAQTNPKNGTKLPLYPAFNDTSRVLSVLEAGLPVEVLKQLPSVKDGRVVLWYRVRSEDGREGWTYGQNLVWIEPWLVIGSLAEVYDYSDSEYLTLYQAPSTASLVLRVLSPGERVRIVGEGDDWYWCQVRTEDGLTGWMKLYWADDYTNLYGFPWAPKLTPGGRASRLF